MHDPMVVAFTIPRPWPQREARPFGPDRWRFKGKFWNLAGRGIYWPSVVTVWHVEPHGADALRGECRGTRWQWHVHHEDCSAIDTAHRTCICQRGPWESTLSGYAYGLCSNCGKRRAWLPEERRDPRNPKEQSELLLASIPKEQRDPTKTAQTRAWRAQYRAETKENAHG